jgi:hypothetical protein
MDLTPYTQNLRDDLLTAASVGDEDSRRAAALLASAIEPAARLAIMNALSDLAAEVTGALQDTTVELRLDGRDVRVSVTQHRAADARDAGYNDSFYRKPAADRQGTGDDATATNGDDSNGGQTAEELRRAMQDAGGELSRTTVRLFNELKSQAERAASEQGVSLNTYISRAVSDSVRSAVPNKGGHKGRGPGGPSGRNVTGYIRG